MMKLNIFHIAVLAIGLSANIEFATAKSGIKITTNAYEGIVVAFHPDTTESEGLPLIPQIQDLFRNGSRALFKATKQRAYFKSVTILVPQKWSRSTTYKRATSELFLEADVRIDAPNPRYGDGPYTLQTLPCGDPGLFIHLTPNYLKFLNENSTTLFGDPGKTIVHEWAHLRYGIFDEFGIYKDTSFPLFYYDSFDGEVRPNACANEKLKGKYWDPIADAPCKFVSGLPDENCFFKPNLKTNKANTSIASYHFLPDVHFFCEDDTHNIRAPNKQNTLCDYKSTWEVITNNEDFKNNKNPSLEVEPNLEPNFSIVQQMEDTFSVVLDISGSMNDPMGSSQYTRLNMATDSLRKWLSQDVKEGSVVGIITFSTGIDSKYHMIKINNQADRDTLIGQLPPKTSGWTCIGCGLNAGIAQLSEYRRGIGGNIILLTDGAENERPFIEEVQDTLVKANIRVNTIALTANAEPKITALADITGGKAYFIKDGDLQALGSAFYDASTYQTADFDLPVIIADEGFSFDSSKRVADGTFSIDETIGNSTTITFQYIVANDIKNITISASNWTLSLDDSKTDNHEIVDDEYTKTIQFKFHLLDPGNYNYTIVTNGAANQNVTVTVTSKAKESGVLPITTRCWAELKNHHQRPVIAIFAEVKQGTNAVINAAVVAQIDGPDGLKLLQLLDKGNGSPDVTRNDGVYSGYFKQFNKQGNYAIKAQVAGDGETSIQEMGFVASQSMPVVNDYMASIDVATKPAGKFERTASSNSIHQPTDIAVDPTDPTPPNRIMNLKAVNSSSLRFSVTLQWTAPEDNEQGNVSSYELRYSKDWNELHSNFENATLIDLDETPSAANLDEKVTVYIDGVEINNTYFFAIKSSDVKNRTSDPSNIVQTTFRDLQALTLTTLQVVENSTTEAETTGVVNTTGTVETTTSSNDSAGLSGGAIAGIVIVVILVLVGGGVGLYYCLRKRNRLV